MNIKQPRRPKPKSQPTFEPLPASPIPRYETWHFHSAILPDDRVLSVYLPPQYAASPTRTFPVFYLHDGQNLIDPTTSYIPGCTWRAGATADSTNADATVEPLILVGIANTGLRRMPEYTPTRDPRLGGGEGALYARLLIEEVKPFIDRTYRTQPAATGLGGSSLGGLITLYLGFQRPDIFSRLAILSPSIWWDHRAILAQINAATSKPPVKIWLDIGTAEGLRHVNDTKLLSRMLLRQGFTLGQDLDLLIVPNAVHDESAWADRFDQVLRFLFPTI